MQIAFKYYTIQLGGTPQPLIGSWITAAVILPAVQAANRREHSDPVLVAVNDSSMFSSGCWVNVIDPVTFATERAMVFNVPDSTHINVQGMRAAHPGGAYGTGSWVSYGGFAETVYVQALDGNTGSLFVGTIPQMVKATGVGVMKKILQVAAATQPNEMMFTQQGPTDSQTLSQFWIDGTTGDSYLPSLGVI